MATQQSKKTTDSLDEMVRDFECRTGSRVVAGVLIGDNNDFGSWVHDDLPNSLEVMNYIVTRLELAASDLRRDIAARCDA